MHLATQLLVLFHLIGFASLFGGLLVQARSTHPEVNPAMVHGALTQLVTWVALVVRAQVGGTGTNWVEIAIKGVVPFFVLVIVVVNRRYESIPRGLWLLLSVLTLA